jgi:uncharacterized protein involved in response to NO
MSVRQSYPAIFNLGFRTFFAGASLFAIVSICCWLAFYSGIISLPLTKISPFQWHAHEMIFGYSLAVIAGFLLTAVKNWTNIPTPYGYPLASIFALWFVARFTWLLGDQLLFVSAFFDLSFILVLIYVIAKPIVIRKQWKQLAVLSKLILLGVGNFLFYLDALGVIETGIQIAIYGGLYLVIGLILTIGRRIIPLFVTNGVDYPVTLYNARWLDVSSLLFFLAFFVSILFIHSAVLSQLSASMMFVITSIRIIGWYTKGVWRNPLLWCFYIALLFIDLGFLLFALTDQLNISPFLSVHAFAFGAIGVMTMGMMGRVSTGHTGRDIKSPPRRLFFALLCLSIGATVRTIFPIVLPAENQLWIMLSGALWIIAFSLFALTFWPYWKSPRPDGKSG